jgi:hypothetical protein
MVSFFGFHLIFRRRPDPEIVVEFRRRDGHRLFVAGFLEVRMTPWKSDFHPGDLPDQSIALAGIIVGATMAAPVAARNWRWFIPERREEDFIPAYWRGIRQLDKKKSGT